MKTRFLAFIFIIITILTITACATKPKEPKVRSETFIADINSFYIGELHLYTRMTISNPKISDFELTFAPRSNFVTAKVKIGLDVIKIGFSYKERMIIKDIAEKYIDDYKNSLLKNENPTNKNALLKSVVPLSWGVFGYSHSVNVKYYVNIEYLESEKPYFRLRFEATDDPDDGSATPAFSIYISPSQWQTIFEMCNQELLEAQVDSILEQAEAF